MDMFKGLTKNQLDTIMYELFIDRLTKAQKIELIKKKLKDHIDL